MGILHGPKSAPSSTNLLLTKRQLYYTKFLKENNIMHGKRERRDRDIAAAPDDEQSATVLFRHTIQSDRDGNQRQ